MHRLVPSRAITLLLGAASLVAAGPYPRDDAHDVGYAFLMPRNCASYCGAQNQFCCDSSQVCTTMPGNVATCVGQGGYYGALTTTWTETRTFTSTYFTNYAPPPQPTAGVDCIPQSDDQEPCGSVCCAGWQTCAFMGQCSPKPGYDPPSTVVITSNGVVTTQYSAPYRVTGTTVVTTTAVQSSQTATRTNTADASTKTEDGDEIGGVGGGGGGGGLSAGAIAGIVIGCLAAIALLLLLCFCCIARGLWHAIFGRKEKESKERVDIYEERVSRHGSRVPSAHSRKDRHSGWFGFGGGKPGSAGDRREKKSGGKWWLGIAGAAATILALLNLKKDKKPDKKSHSRYSESYYTYDSSSSPSKFSL